MPPLEEGEDPPPDTDPVNASSQYDESITPIYSILNFYGDNNADRDEANENGKGTWFTDETDPTVSYASFFDYPPTNSPEEESAENSAATPSKNSRQMCAGARVMKSSIPGVPLVEAEDGVNINLKMGTNYPVSNNFMCPRTDGTQILFQGYSFNIFVSESAAAVLAAATSAALALYAF